MNKVLKNSWALFLGMGAIMLAYGFQGSLLGVRAVKEEFSLTATGFMMSGSVSYTHLTLPTKRIV